MHLVVPAVASPAVESMSVVSVVSVVSVMPVMPVMSVVPVVAACIIRDVPCPHMWYELIASFMVD